MANESAQYLLQSRGHLEVKTGTLSAKEKAAVLAVIDLRLALKEARRLLLTLIGC